LTAPATTQRHRALTQQGYDYSPRELNELQWGLRFTPTVCMLLAVWGLATQQPAVHLALAALGILPFWAPSWHPFDRLYNDVLRPVWRGVALPPNPLPRRIACFMGGSMNIAIALSFMAGNVPLAYAFGGALIVLQIIVITTHFCVASWMYEGVLRALRRWTAPESVDKLRQLLQQQACMIDVRNPEEFAAGHLDGAENVPLDEIPRRLAGRQDDCLIVYCKSGLRSQRATQLLKRQGYRRVFNLGAMSRWQ